MSETLSDTAAAGRWGRRIGWILLAAGVVFVGVQTFALLERRLGSRDAGDASIALIWTALCAGMLVHYVVRHGLGRRILVRGNRRGIERVVLASGVILLTAGLWVLWRNTGERSDRILRHLWWIPNGLYLLVWGSGRPQILDEGIWASWSLYRWSEVESLGWSDEHPSRLTLYLGKRSGAAPTVEFDVPTEDRELVEALVARRMIANGVTSGGPLPGAAQEEAVQ